MENAQTSEMGVAECIRLGEAAHCLPYRKRRRAEVRRKRAMSMGAEERGDEDRGSTCACASPLLPLTMSVWLAPIILVMATDMMLLALLHRCPKML